MPCGWAYCPVDGHSALWMGIVPHTQADSWMGIVVLGEAAISNSNISAQTLISALGVIE